MKKILCASKHRMVQILPELWLCECSEYGAMADLKGAVPEARAMVERQLGGIERLRNRIELEEAEARDARKRSRNSAGTQPAPRIRGGV